MPFFIARLRCTTPWIVREPRAIWRGHWSVNLYLSVVGSLDAWLSPGRARRCKPRAQACPRAWPSCNIDVCGNCYIGAPYLLWKLRGTNAELDALFDVADEKGASVWKVYGMVHQGWLFALTRNASDAIDTITSWNYCNTSVNGQRTLFCAAAFIVFG